MPYVQGVRSWEVPDEAGRGRASFFPRIKGNLLVIDLVLGIRRQPFVLIDLMRGIQIEQRSR